MMMGSEAVAVIADWVSRLVSPQDWEHVTAVARLALTDDERMTAYLHDIYEDGIVTEKDVRCHAPANVADAVVILARQRGEVYEDYITRIVNSHNRLAMTVKVYDLMDHLMPHRAAHYRDRAHDAKRYRYIDALEELHTAFVGVTLPANP